MDVWQWFDRLKLGPLMIVDIYPAIVAALIIGSLGGLAVWALFRFAMDHLRRSKHWKHAQNAQAYYNTGVVAQQQRDFNEAEAMWRKAIEVDPQLARAYSNLGVLLMEQQRDAEAEEMCRKAIEVDPQLAQAYTNLGVLLKGQERDAEAEAMWYKAIEVDPQQALAHNNLGGLLKGQKRYAEAEVMVRKAIKVEPQKADGYHNLGVLLKALQRYDEAEAMYRKAIEIDPQLAQAYSNLGVLLRTQGKFGDAVKIYRLAIQRSALRVDLLIGLADCYRHASDMKAMQEQIQLARALAVEDDIYNTACLESVEGNAQTALDFLQKASALPRFDRAWVWQDPDLYWIRDDPRFAQIAGEKPQT